MLKGNGNHLVDSKDIKLPDRQRGSHKPKDYDRFMESLKREKEKGFKKQD